MDFKRLKYFCTLVEHGSFSKAAKSLYISQPPLSQRIRELEDGLGVQLLQRGSRGVQVTPEGEKLYRHAQYIISYMQNFEKEFQNSIANPTGMVRIGVCPPCNSLIIDSLPEIQQKFPRLTFRIWLMDNQSLERHMQEVHLDFAILQLPLANHNYKIIRLRSHPFCAVYSPLLKAPEKKTVTARELAGKNLLLSRRRDGGGSFDLIMRNFQGVGIEPNIVVDTQDNRILLELLEKGMNGIAIVPENELPANHTFETRLLNFNELRTFPVITVLAQGFLSTGAFGLLRFLYEKYKDPEDKKDYLRLLFEDEQDG